MKLAQYSHQCGPLNVCTWKTAAERKITEGYPTISQTSVSMHLNGAEFLFFEGTTCSFWKLPFTTAGKEKRTKTDLTTKTFADLWKTRVLHPEPSRAEELGL